MDSKEHKSRFSNYKSLCSYTPTGIPDIPTLSIMLRQYENPKGFSDRNRHFFFPLPSLSPLSLTAAIARQ